MNNSYPFIRAYGQIMGSYSYYIEDQLRKAKEDNAPADAWSYEDPDGTGGPRVWRKASDLIDNGPHSLRAQFSARGLYEISQ